MASLSSRSSRKRLATGRYYWRVARRGLHVGWRRPKGGAAGAWYARWFNGKSYTQRRLAAADDVSAANDRDVLNFAQAMKAANDFSIATLDKIEEPISNYTVRQCCKDYVKHLETEGRSASAVHDTELRINAVILPKLGKIECADLTANSLREWRDALAVPNTRARRATANRTWTILRAALNLGFQRERIASDAPWRRIKPFKGTDAPRTRWLTVAEAKQLLAACQGDFRHLVEAALHTGCRYGELIGLRVGDFARNNGTLHIAQSKSGKPRDVVLTDAGTAFFQRLCEGREAKEQLLLNGARPWRKSEQSRPMAAAVKAAGLPAINFHGLRHTWASLAVQAGVPLIIVAKNLGHAGTRMVERHYGHLAQDYVTDAIRAGAPTFV